MADNIILDWKKYLEASARAVSEGIVMLKNDNGALPLSKGERVSVFGRIQLHYYKSGTGSGGMVNVSEVIGITDALIDGGEVEVNTELLNVYRRWDEENPFDKGSGWGTEPWSQTEMPLDDDIVAAAAARSETAIVIIGRTAGEEQDNRLEKGAFLLSDAEENMLKRVRGKFGRMIVLLNVGGLIDMGFIDRFSPDSVLYVWQGGMVGGTGTEAVLTGKISPSGKLTDTIAYSVSDYPSDRCFGDPLRNFYCEDIYVGYRYFETFMPDKVRYPFGFGLSYTRFSVDTVSVAKNADGFVFDITVTNLGTYSGKEVVQIYCSAPQGKLGKPSRVLCGYAKTSLLASGEKELLRVNVRLRDIASYDDSGMSGHKHCFVLEGGVYSFYVGTDVRSAEKTFETELTDTAVERLEQALAPVLSFERIRPVACENGFTVGYEAVPVSEVDERERREKNLPSELAYTGDRGIKLADILDGKAEMSDFIGQLSDYDLSCIVRGEGMGSPKVTAGTAAAFGGVSSQLAKLGIPCGCCSDGPSGMRLDCGTKAFSIPNGTLLASSFNRQLISELFAYMGLEMRSNNVDCLLGPGINIHRHILNGRNFEYFSEDPFLTGTIAAAELEGLHSVGAEGTVKHFCANNQETNRHNVDSVISERALREIYLRGFEIAFRDGGARAVMTTYSSLNGLWTSGSYDLTTTVLRNDWGFDGFVMTDWWANINERGRAPDKTDFASMVRAQNDVYMVCADGAANNDNIMSSLENGNLFRSELQRSAANICRFIMKTQAMKRLCGKGERVKVINRPTDCTGTDAENVVFYRLGDYLRIDLSDFNAEKGRSFVFALDIERLGYYSVTVTASSGLSEFAQIPVTLFSLSTVCAGFTFNGTDGESSSVTRETSFFSRYSTLRLFFAQSGLDVKSIEFNFVRDV